MLEISKKKKDDFTLILLKGRLDSTNVIELEKEIESLHQDNIFDMVFDLSGLEYISSAGLRVFLIVYKKSSEKKAKYALFALQGLVKEVFDLAGFSNILPIFDSYEDVKF